MNPLLRNAKFFLIKSVFQGNISISQQENAWATLPHNEQKFAHAFFVSEFSIEILILDVFKNIFQNFLNLIHRNMITCSFSSLSAICRSSKVLPECEAGWLKNFKNKSKKTSKLQVENERWLIWHTFGPVQKRMLNTGVAHFWTTIVRVGCTTLFDWSSNMLSHVWVRLSFK